jgi:predicted ATPase
MRILDLCVRGFRSLKDVEWHPGCLNVVIGPNGSGKSNLLRLLELLSISAQGRLSKYVQSSGGIEPLLWDGMADEIAISLKALPPGVDQSSLTYEVQIAPVGRTGYRIDNELLVGNYSPAENGALREPFKFIERHGLKARIFDQDNHALVALEEAVPEEESLLSTSAGPFAANRYVSDFRRELAGWSVYHDLHVNRDAPIRQPTITRLEKRVDPDGQNLISVLHTLYTGDRNFKATVNAAMSAAFGDDYDELVFPPAADQKIQMRVRWKSLSKEQSAADLSDGTLRFLFLLTVLSSPSPAPLIAIDEPETGLHPSMLSIVAEHAVEASRRVQVILTTHSPQFLNAFTGTMPTTTVTKWLDGQTTLKVINGAELERWLQEYSLGALYESGELEDME